AFGWRFVRVLAFPLLFLVFMVPLPQMVIDSVTASLKQAVSAIAEDLLYFIGYPIARSGVVLMVGQYQLLVADACSG
ncbi:archaeosortase/exosortase family protein, partial [Escherichia coli]|nr:archaeosortase/exosortase family protein [Escherichia coli]